MRKIGYIALSLYLLLAGLSTTIANLMIPNILMALLAFIGSFGIFLDVCIPTKKEEKKANFNSPPKNFNHP